MSTTKDNTPVPTEATEAPRTVGTNSTKLPWPQDRTGSCQELRRGSVRAIGRIKGNEVQLEMVLETLAVAADYAREQYAAGVKTREASLVRLQNAEKAREKLRADERRAVVNARRAALKQAEKDLKAAETAVKEG